MYYNCFITGGGTDVKSHVSNHVRKLRFESGEMTQQALAEKVGVTRQTVIAIEAGKYAPSLEVAFRMAEVFKVTLDEVFEFRQNETCQNET